MSGPLCRWARRRESLQSGMSARIAHRHLRRCAACRTALEEREQLESALRERPVDVPSRRLWARIGAVLERPGGAVARGHRPGDSFSGFEERGAGARARRVLDDLPTWAIAAVAVLSVGLALTARSWQRGGLPFLDGRATPGSPAATQRGEASGDDLPATTERRSSPWELGLEVVPLNLDLGSYVGEVSGRATPARFWHAYRAIDVDAGDRTEWSRLAFRPLAPPRLPGGLVLTDAKLLKDACCETLQLRYESSEFEVDLFELHDTHPVEFGEALARRIDVGGVVCTAFAWRDAAVRARSFQRDDVTVVLVGNAPDERMDEIVRALGEL